MRSLILGASLALAAKAAEEGAKYYTDLDPSSFDKFLESEELGLVMFYAPWCGHCKAMGEPFNNAARILKDEGIALAKVDCTTEQPLCDRFGVRGFPTLKIFRGKLDSPYEGGRTESEILEYMRQKALPAISHFKSLDEIEGFKKKSKVSVVLYHTGQSTPLYETYAKVVDEMRDKYIFAAVEPTEIHKAANVSEPKLVLYKTFDEGVEYYDSKEQGEPSVENFKAFIEMNSVPLLDDISPENYSSYVASGKPLAFLFVANDEQRTTAGAAVKEVAKEFRGKMNFVFIDTEKYGSHARNLNLKEGDWPAFGIQSLKEGLKFPLDQSSAITKEAVASHVKGVLDGSISPSLKSEPIPESNDGPVKIVVGKTYDEIVNDKTQDVLLALVAQWCGHCQRLKPIYEELGKKLSGSSNITIAKMDATENDLPPGVPFTVEGFPTIKLVKAETNEILDYAGDRSLDSFVKMIKEHAVHKSQVTEETETTKEGEESPEAETPTPKKPSETNVKEEAGDGVHGEL